MFTCINQDTIPRALAFQALAIVIPRLHQGLVGCLGEGANLVGFNVHVHEGQPAGVGVENNLAGSYKPKPSGRIF